MNGSEVFGPFRPVGVVCGPVGAAATELYGQPMLMVPIRRTFQLYKGEALAMVRGGPEFEDAVSCVAQAGKLRYAAEGASIHAFSLHKPLWTKKHNASLRSTVLGLTAVDELLFSFADDGRCVVWNGRDGSESSAFSLGLPPRTRYTCAVVPPHFKNKLLVGCSDGVVRLYNFHTGKKLFEWTVPRRDGSSVAASLTTVTSSKKAGHAAAHDDEPIAVTAMAAAAFRGIIAVGLSDARAVVYHFEQDVVLAEFTHDTTRKDTSAGAAADDEAAGASSSRRAMKQHRSAVAESLRPSTSAEAGSLPSISAIAFRSDDQGRTLATATSRGEIAFWDLSEKKLAGAISGTKQVKGFDELTSNPHRDVVHTLYFVPGKPLLVSCGADNAMVEYRLDTVDGLALAVRDRRGHTGRCTAAAFYNNELLVTAGEDRAVRVTHCFSDRAAWELSQGKLGRRAREQGTSRDALRLPPATQLVCNPARNYQWASIVTVHDCSAKLCGWRLDTRALEHKIEPIRTTAHACTAVALSDCGNFAVVGYSSGHVTRVTLQDQSLLHFYAAGGRAVEGSTAGDRAHPDGGKITGIYVFQWADVVATCAADGTVRTWRLTTGDPLAELQLDSPIHVLVGHSPSLLLCAGCADFTIRVISLTDGRSAPQHSDGGSSTGAAVKAAATVVRSLRGHAAPISAIALSPESLKHLVSAGSDGSLVVWDLSSAQCIAQYRLPSPATSLAFHPDSYFLCSTHAGEPGAFLWTNRLRYGLAPEAITPALGNIRSCPLLHFPKQSHDADVADDDAEADGEVSDKKKKASEAEKSAASSSTSGARVDPLCPPAHIMQLYDEASKTVVGRTISLSGKGVDYWETLSKLDQIRERNEPLLPPKKAAVPFFLQSTSELKPTFIIAPPTEEELSAAQKTAKDKEDLKNRFAHFSAETGKSEFATMLAAEQFDACLDWMAAATAAQIDLRVKSILKDHEDDDETGVIYEQNEKAAAVLLKFVAHALSSMRHFDLVQAFVRLVFQEHGELLANHPRLAPLLDDVGAAQRRAVARFSASFGRVNCLGAAFSNAYA